MICQFRDADHAYYFLLGLSKAVIKRFLEIEIDILISTSRRRSKRMLTLSSIDYNARRGPLIYFIPTVPLPIPFSAHTPCQPL